MDASSLLGIAEQFTPAEQDEIWALLERLVDAQRLKTVRLVVEEVRRNDDITFRRLVSVRQRIVVADAELTSSVGPIVQRFPRMSRPWSTRDKADPWLVALAQAQSLTVVTEEADRPGKIPHACRQLGVGCCTLAKMVAVERATK